MFILYDSYVGRQISVDADLVRAWPPHAGQAFSFRAGSASTCDAPCIRLYRGARHLNLPQSRRHGRHSGYGWKGSLGPGP